MSDIDRLLETFADIVARRVIEMQKTEAQKKTVVYLTPEQMAERQRVSVKTLANLRSAKKGPKFIKVGGAVRYPVEDGIT